MDPEPSQGQKAEFQREATDRLEGNRDVPQECDGGKAIGQF